MNFFSTEVRETVNNSLRGVQVTGHRDAPKFSHSAIVTLLVLAALICYGNVLANGFVYDDEQQILQNPYVKEWRFLPQIFGTTVWSFIGQAGTTNYYRPLMTFSYLILWKVFGDLPFGFHLLNLLVHLMVVALIYYAGLALFKKGAVAWLAASIFAVHPIHTEAVAWIAALPDLAMTLFVLLAFWFYPKGGHPAWKVALRVTLSYALALLSKEPGLMLAPLLVAYEHGVRPGAQGKTLGEKFARYAPVCATCVAYLGMRIALFGKVAPVLQHATISLPQAIYSAFAMVADYARLLVYPVHLSAFHVFHVSKGLQEGPVLVGLGLVLSCVAAILILRRKFPEAAFAILWIGMTLAPVLNARWMASNVETERYLYLPSAGFCWFLAWACVGLWEFVRDKRPAWRPFAMAGAGSLAAALTCACVLTIERNRVWRNDVVLYTSTLEADPDAHVIRSNLAGVYFDMGDLTRAGTEWERALTGKPDNVVTMNALGMLYTKQGRYPDAEAMFLRAIVAKPVWADAHYNYGVLLQKMGRNDEGLAELRRAVDLAPLNAEARRFYADALLQAGNLEEAEKQLVVSLEYEQTLEASHSLAEVYLKRGKVREAEQLLRGTTRKYPFDSTAHFHLGQILEESDRFEEARAEYQEGLKTDPRNTDARSALERISKKP
jgi:protein O-mannosyl-transferase